jgi:hypothetical protein
MFTLVDVVSRALDSGANTAIFQLINIAARRILSTQPQTTRPTGLAW